ncbi:MAG: hypothetical protein ABIG71_00700 [Candidatus Uhrbacteria bacterium]
MRALGSATQNLMLGAIALVAVGCSAEASGTMEAREDAALRKAQGEVGQLEAKMEPLSVEEIRELLGDACALLERSDARTIVAVWPGVMDAMSVAIERQRWGADPFQWYADHPIEAVIAACDLKAETRNMLMRFGERARVQDAEFSALLERERTSMCTFGQSLAEASSYRGEQWTDVMREQWTQRCTELLTTAPPRDLKPKIPEQREERERDAHSVARDTRAPTQAHIPQKRSLQGCIDLETLVELRPEMSRTWGQRSGGLSEQRWLAYGYALSSCSPQAQPWEGKIRYPPGQGRGKFVKYYVRPFVEGDVLRGLPFARHKPQLMVNIQRNWGL